MARYRGVRGPLFGELRRLEESQFWPPERLLSLQEEKLVRLAEHAYAHVPYYREVFDARGLRPEEFGSLQTLRSLPPLTKQVLRDRSGDLLATNIPAATRHEDHSSGTTGGRISFWRDSRCLGPREAALLRFERWTGWEFGDRVGFVWPTPQDYLHCDAFSERVLNFFGKRHIPLPVAFVVEREIDSFIEKVLRLNPTVFRGSPQGLALLAQRLQEKGLILRGVRGAVTTTECLLAPQREAIQAAFGCGVFDSYRTREVGPIGQECSEHTGMHIAAEHLIVEIVGEDGEPVEDGAIGRILVTDLLNRAMPLMRYEIEDMGRMGQGPCLCGRTLPLLAEIGGRLDDIFWCRDGRRFLSRALAPCFVVGAPDAWQGDMQVIQEDYDRLCVRLRARPRPSDRNLSFLQEKARELFGPATRVQFEFLESIPRSASGKYRFGYSLVKTKGVADSESDP